MRVARSLKVSEIIGRISSEPRIWKHNTFGVDVEKWGCISLFAGFCGSPDRRSQEYEIFVKTHSEYEGDDGSNAADEGDSPGKWPQSDKQGNDDFDHSDYIRNILNTEVSLEPEHQRTVHH